jgi:CheY-like chemotaxis protein
MIQLAEQIAYPADDTKMPMVLVVEDDAASRKLMRKTLQQDGFLVSEAENGAQALALFDEQYPDIVLMDVEMPVMNGFKACAKLRERQHA